MKFTTPCFVCVKDAGGREELDVWLRGIGRKTLASKNQPYIVASEDSILWCNLDGCTIDVMTCQGYIDCGTDIELFKALAAMNSENDREQWFVGELNKESIWWRCNQSDRRERFMKGCLLRKATAEEIIEHFKL